ncbi:hypothetical protein KUCAC02_034227, partial [Chaenocephalus aceratus]
TGGVFRRTIALGRGGERAIDAELKGSVLKPGSCRCREEPQNEGHYPVGARDDSYEDTFLRRNELLSNARNTPVKSISWVLMAHLSELPFSSFSTNERSVRQKGGCRDSEDARHIMMNQLFSKVTQ